MRSIREFLNITSARDKAKAVICAAIDSRRVIEFYYHGGYRTVEPFCLGLVLSGEADNVSLLCYQTGGFSELREVVGWKMYRISDMTEIEMLGDRFSSDRPGYDPDAVSMDTIYCSIVPSGGYGAAAHEALETGQTMSPEALRTASKKTLSHNELMEKFRFAHRRPVPGLYDGISPGPSRKASAEPVKSKFWRFKRILDKLPIIRKTG
jgi:hypothetical protein